MSFPVPKYVCTGCDWVGYAAMVGMKRYRLPSGGYLNINKTTAWCHACCTLRPVEAIPTVEQAEAFIARAQAKLDEVVASGRPGPWWWPNKEYRTRVGYARDALEEAQGWREFFEHRKSPPRCLKCGGFDSEPMPPHQFRKGHDLAQLPMLHPGCPGGGHIVGHFGKLTGARMGTPAHVHEYSIDGELVAEVANQPPFPRRWR